MFRRPAVRGRSWFVGMPMPFPRSPLTQERQCRPVDLRLPLTTPWSSTL